MPHPRDGPDPADGQRRRARTPQAEPACGRCPRPAGSLRARLVGPRRVLRLLPPEHHRCHAHRRRHRPRLAVPGPRAHQPADLRDDRHQPRSRDGPRVGHQVFLPRGALGGRLPLRLRDDLRRDRLHRIPPDRHDHRRDADRQRGGPRLGPRRAHADSRPDALGARPLLQDRRRADASLCGRRLRRRGHPGHRLPRGGAQDRRLRRADPAHGPARLGLARPARHAAGRPRRADHDHRQRAGDHSEQPQTHPRLLVDRALRLPAHRARGRRVADRVDLHRRAVGDRQRRRRRPLLPARLRDGYRRLVCRARLCPPAGRR